MPLQLAELENGEPDQSQLLSLFRDMEFKTWIEEARQGHRKCAHRSQNSGGRVASNLKLLLKTVREEINKDYQTVLTEADFDIWIDKIKAAELVAVDTETTSLDYMRAQLVGISLAVAPGEAAYIPFGHDYLGAPEQLSQEFVLEKIKPLLEDACNCKSRSKPQI